MFADLGLFIVRVVVGLLFMGHGLQKLAGWFGGHGIAGTGQWMESIGLRPGRAWAVVAGLLETVGGLFFGLGVFTPLGTVFICAVMLMAIARVHWPKGLWVTNGGSEYPLTSIAVTIGVALAGPGRFALEPYTGVSLPLAPVLIGGLVMALLVVAVAPRPQAKPTVQPEMRQAA
ncbi:MAG: DoxX family protein [Armatimonadota bacterium]|nr:DoxX family protein [Armatimonadota bacterium]